MPDLDATPVRLAAVLVTAAAGAAAPPGVDRHDFLRAVAEDTYEIVAGLELVTPVLVTSVPGLDDLVWPGTPVIGIAESSGQSAVRTAFEALAATCPDATQAVVISADAPDLPPLLIGKLFRELGRAHLTVCQAEGGGAVAVAAPLPLPEWAHPDLDAPDTVARLRAAAPGRRMVATGPGWHRLRAAEDVSRLDPGLEGWENTRGLLSGRTLRSG
ncbi:hypothetical protein SAMN05421505_109182 [Sinosporangium album]|uniref:MobA-like NTP transferase domain-containing protein n=1 Tax=Sinosporangium album TaxID=504805 RepID=A0A1G7YBQ2_9ACTN|nr:hypothetical protein [Sinosporangium album]SDG93793.1 hypothetical protein SAMN05421505_109182 [Sinosporangium album]